MRYLNGKRYYSMAQMSRERFGGRTVKIPLCSGMTCPNRDGTKGFGGCSFCTGMGGGEFSPQSREPLLSQFERECQKTEKWHDAVKIAYFQSFSNTYADADRVKALLDEALMLPDIGGIRLATRGDCIDREKADIIAAANRLLPVEVELGLQTVHDETADLINRKHSFDEFLHGYSLLKERGIYVCVHLINGLPLESTEMMLESAKILGRLRPNGVKLHMLHILRGSKMAEQYQKEPFELLSKEQYVDVVCGQLRLFPCDTVIERLTGDGAAENLIAPLWTRNKRGVLNLIDKTLAERDIRQGDKLGG